MEALHRFEQHGGTINAFAGEEARERDVRWVSAFRHKAAFSRFTPHVTLGHAPAPPHIEPFDFEATAIAACHLGRFCTCRRALREWTLSAPEAPPPDSRFPSA